MVVVVVGGRGGGGGVAAVGFACVVVCFRCGLVNDAAAQQAGGNLGAGTMLNSSWPYTVTAVLGCS